MEIDQEIIEAQERLIRKREEDKTTVREDLGYQRNTSPNIYRLFQKRTGSETLSGLSLLSTDRVKVTYIKGIAQGLTHTLRADIGRDLIRQGYAKEVIPF